MLTNVFSTCYDTLVQVAIGLFISVRAGGDLQAVGPEIEVDCKNTWHEECVEEIGGVCSDREKMKIS